MIMVDTHTLLHEEDDMILSGEFQFDDQFFTLKEKHIPILANNFYTPSEKNK